MGPGMELGMEPELRLLIGLVLVPVGALIGVAASVFFTGLVNYYARGLQAADLVVAVVGRPALERGLTGGEEALTPLRQRRSSHPELARERVELLAVQQPQHRLCLASRREATALPPTIRPLR